MATGSSRIVMRLRGRTWRMKKQPLAHAQRAVPILSHVHPANTALDAVAKFSGVARAAELCDARLVQDAGSGHHGAPANCSVAMRGDRSLWPEMRNNERQWDARWRWPPGCGTAAVRWSFLQLPRHGVLRTEGLPGRAHAGVLPGFRNNRRFSEWRKAWVPARFGEG